VKPRLLATLACLIALLAAPAAPRADIGTTIGQLQAMVSGVHLTQDVRHLEAFDTRFVASVNAPVVVQELYDELVFLGWETGIEEFEVRHPQLGTVASWNVIARREGTDPGGLVVIGAHWDSIDDTELDGSGTSFDDPEKLAPGADDNASGVAVLLELAQLLGGTSFQHDIEICFFGAEEVGRQGSGFHAASLADQGAVVLGYLNVDMVGFDETTHDCTIFHNTASTTLAQEIEILAETYSPILAETEIIEGSNSDAWSFWYEGYAGVSIWEGHDHAPHANDDADTFVNCITPPFHLAMAKMVLGVFCHMAGIETVTAAPGAAAPILPRVQAWPNPFQGATTLRLAAGAAGGGRLAVFDAAGRLLRVLETAGGSALWDGRDDRGRRLPAGVYYVRPASGRLHGSGRVVLLD